MEQDARTIALIGEEAFEKIKASNVAVFGIGGVGGYVCEALARAGVGHLTLVDADTVNVTNINRQIIALHSTVGRYKTEVMKERIADINADTFVTCRNVFFLPENAETFDFSEYTYIIDAIDTVAGKIALIEKAQKAGVRVISSMGAGNHLDPTAFRVTDIYKTNTCPLAKVMRRECRARGIAGFKAVYSLEEPKMCGKEIASISFVPGAAGLVIAGEVLRDIAGIKL